MKKKNAAQHLKEILPALVFSVLLTLAVFVATSMLLTAIFYHDQYGKRDFTPAYIVMVLYFQLSFWIFYTRKTSNENARLMQKTFSWKEDLKATLRGEGIILMIVLAFLGLIFESSLILYAKYAEIPAQNPIGLALVPMFSLAMCTGIENLLIVRTIIAYIVTVILIFLQLIWQHSRCFKKWNR